MFGAVFAWLGTATWMTNALLASPLPPWATMSLLLTLIFLLGWPFEWPAIVFIFLPMLAPVAKGLGYDMVWFGCIVAVVLQTAFLSPPVAMSAYYLKQVVKEWNLRLIYRGMADFMVLQCRLRGAGADLPGHRHVVPAMAAGAQDSGTRPRRSSRSRRCRTSLRHPTVHALRSGISEFFRRPRRRYKDALPDGGRHLRLDYMSP